MALSKKHYEMIAKRFQQQVNEDLANPEMTSRDRDAARESMQQLACKLARTFMYDNPNFNMLRFLTACGF